MKKRTVFFVIIITSLVFYSAGIPRETYRVKTMVRFLTKGQDLTQYFYNPDGHIARILHSTSPEGGDSSTYQYMPGKVLVKHYKYYTKDEMRMYEKKTNLQGVDTLMLNEYELAEKKTHSNYSSVEEYEYNSDKNLIKMWFEPKGALRLDKYEYKDGNRISYTNRDSAGLVYQDQYYQYDKNQPNTVGNENIGCDFLGRDSKNAITYSGSLYAYPTGGCLGGLGEPGKQLEKPNWLHGFKYHCDDRGRISSRICYDIKSGKVQDSTCYIYYTSIKMVLDK